MSDATTMAAVQRALAEGQAVRLNMETVTPPTREQTQSARDEVEYASFARAFGWLGDDGEPEPPRLVSMPKAEYDEMVQNAAKLPELVGRMRQRPADASPEDEAEYAKFAAQFGWE